MLLAVFEKKMKTPYFFDSLEKGLVLSTACFSHLKSVSVSKKIIDIQR